MKTSTLETHRKTFCSTMANKHKISKSDLERDSGFSDASSGYFSALEFDDMGSNISADPNMQLGSQVPLVAGSYQGVSPMILMNNLVLKQPNSATPALKPWGFNTSLEVPPSPMVLLQPFTPGGNCNTQMSASHQKQGKDYFPILNSFLKIAPQPVHEINKELGQNTSHKSSSSHGHGGRHRRRRPKDKQTQGFPPKQTPEPTSTAGNSVNLPIFSQNMEDMGLEISSSHHLDFPDLGPITSPFSLCPSTYNSPLPEKSPKATFDSSDDAENFPAALSPSSSKRKRFCNTYNILNRSGLLGITLRTKELIRQNKRSQSQLQKLQKHTDLFLEALNSRDPQVWAKLQLNLLSPLSDESKEDMVGNSGLDATVIDCM